MTVPPDDPAARSERPPWPPVEDDRGRAAAPPPATEEPLDFDPYRFGRPEHPVPPEYAPPGYRPPPTASPTASQYPPAGQPYGSPPPGAYGAPYQQHPYGPPQQYPPYYGPPQSTSNTKATIALVLGILAVVFCFFTFLDLALIIPAIVLGAIGRKDAQREPSRGGRGTALAGLICGVVAAVLVTVILAIALSRVGSCIQQGVSYSDARTCMQNKLFGH